MFYFKTNLDFILDLLIDHCVFSVVEENGIKMSVLFKLRDREVESVVNTEHLYTYAMKGWQSSSNNMLRRDLNIF